MNLKQVLDHYDKIYILNMDFPGTGFGAVILLTLSQIRFCERNNHYPVINYDEGCENAFFDKNYGDDLWEQYFEPLMPHDYKSVQKALASGEINSEDCLTLPSQEMLKIAEEHPDSVYSFTFGKWRFEKPEDLLSWYDEQREKARDIILKYIRLKPHIQQKVDDFYKKNLKDCFVLGIHIRGTDLHYAPPVSPAEYFPHIDKYIEQHPSLKMFLATDQRQYVEVFKEQYGDRVYCADIFRSDNDVAPFNRSEITPYHKGEDVLLDILFLSNANFLLKGASNVSEMALYFNPTLTCLDLSLNKVKAYGQDYGDSWDNITNVPAWKLIKKTNLKEVAKDSNSQSWNQQIVFRIRYLFRHVLQFFSKILKPKLK